MFCPKCGGQNPDGVKFCGSCGADLSSRAPKPATNPAPMPYSGGNQPAGAMNMTAVVIAIVQLILSLLGLMPVLQVGYGQYVASSSLFQLLDATGILGGYASYSSDASTIMGVITVFVWVLIILWLAAVALSIYGLVKVIKGNRFGIAGSVLTLVFAVIIIIVTFVLNGALNEQLSGYASNLISVTLWVWLMLIGPIVCIVVGQVTKK